MQLQPLILDKCDRRRMSEKRRRWETRHLYTENKTLKLMAGGPLWGKKFPSRSKRTGERDYNKLKSFSHCKGNGQKSEETAHRMGPSLPDRQSLPSLPDRQSVPGGSNCREPSAKRITWFLEGDGHTHAMQVWTHTWSYCACGTASGSECRSPSTHKALGTHFCQAGVIDEGEIIRQLMPNPRFSKRPCLKGIRWRMITQHLMPSSGLHACA